MSEAWVPLSDDDEERDWSDQELEYDMWDVSCWIYCNFMIDIYINKSS